MGLVGVVSIYYPDKPSVNRGFEGGLDRELGGEPAVLVSRIPLDLLFVHNAEDIPANNAPGTNGGWYRLVCKLGYLVLAQVVYTARATRNAGLCSRILALVVFPITNDIMNLSRRRMCSVLCLSESHNETFRQFVSKSAT